MRLRDVFEEPLMPIIAFIGLANLVIYAVIPPDSSQFNNLTSLFYDTSVLLSAIALFYVFSFYGRKSFEGKFWFLMGVGMFLWFIAEVIWYYYIANDIEPFPSVADFFFIAAYFPIIGGVVYRAKYSKPSFDAKKIGIVVGSVLLMLIPSYIWVAHPILGDTTYGFWDMFFSMSYIVLDLVLFAFAAMIALYWGSQVSKGWYLISFGLAVMTVADVIFAWMEYNESYDPRIELAWVVFYLLFAVGAIYQKKFHESIM
jgi:hypothetical protein